MNSRGVLLFSTVSRPSGRGSHHHQAPPSVAALAHVLGRDRALYPGRLDPRYELLTTPFNISLVQGLVAIGQLAEGIALIEETIRLVEENGDVAYMPELLRVKGNALLLMPEPMEDKAEECFTQSLAVLERFTEGRDSADLKAAEHLLAILR